MTARRVLADRAGERRRPGRALAGAAALLSVSALALVMLAPPHPTAGDTVGAAGALRSQELTGEAASGIDFDAFKGGAASAAPQAGAATQGETGLFDPSLLTDSAVRYPFDRPMPLTDGFGYRVAPVEQFHDAQDIAAPAGSEIKAIASGLVLEAGWTSDGCGFGLKVQHLVDGETLTSRYCHMESGSHAYRRGDEIRIGDVAGRVGNTGMAFGAHLHLALRLEGEPIDPLPYIAAKAAG